MGVKKVKDLNPPQNANEAISPCEIKNRYPQYLAVLMNQVLIRKKGSDKPLPFIKERFAKRTMFESGSVGYDKITDEFYNISHSGQLNSYGNYTKYTFYTENGQSFEVDASYENVEDGHYEIYALPTKDITISEIIHDSSDYIWNCAVARNQNLEGCKTPYVAVCANENLRDSFNSALQQKQHGQAVILVSEEVGEGLRAQSIAVPYLVDKFTEAMTDEESKLFNKFGILTANTDKKERVQSAEVNADLGKATDLIYTIIDSVNKQFNEYGIPYEMVFNGSMEELYTSQNENDVNNIEKGQENYVKN